MPDYVCGGYGKWGHYGEDSETLDFSNPYIDYAALKELCVIKTTDGEVLYHESLDQVTRYHKLYYGMNNKGESKVLDYYTLINNYDAINFPYLLSNSKFTKAARFVEIFNLIEFYPEILSDNLIFGEDDELIERYKDHKKLNWFTIMANNIPMQSKYLQQYYSYLKRKVLFKSKQEFSKDDLIFVVKNEIELHFNKNYYLTDTLDNLSNLFKFHKFPEQELIWLLKEFKSKKTFNNEVEKDTYNYILQMMVIYIIETQNVTEALVNANKGLFREKSMKQRAWSNVAYSEEYIEKNPNLVLWKDLSINNKLLFGGYSDDFYKNHVNDIEWDNFDYDNLKEFYKQYSFRFRDFLVTFHKNIPAAEILKFLKSNSEISDAFNPDSIVRYFSAYVHIYNGNCKDINENFAMSMLKLKHTNFDIIEFLNSDNFSIKFIKEYKKDIFDVMLNQKDYLKNHIIKKINNLLEELKNNKKQEER